MLENVNTPHDQVNPVDALHIEIGPKREFFAWLPNYYVYGENALSAEGIACAIYLNGQPTGWQPRPSDIKKRFGWGDRVWWRVSKELKDAGLLHEKKIYGGTVLWFSLPEMNLTIKQKHTPLHFDRVSKHTLAKCKDITIEGSLPKKDLLSENDLMIDNQKNDLVESKPDQEKITDPEIAEIFARMWKQYPHKIARLAALKAFTKIFKGKTRGDAENLSNQVWRGLSAYIENINVKAQLKEQGGDIFVPCFAHLSSWLNGKRWDDVYETAEELCSKTPVKGGIIDINKVFG